MSKEKQCYLCDSPEVVNESCTKCKRPYCKIDASKINPALYCDDCQRDVVIEETTYTRTDTEYDEITNKLSQITSKSKQILFKGMDWMFACYQICQQDDKELKPILEYHKAFVMMIESELASRRVSRAHQQVQMNHPTGRRIMNVTKTVKTKVTKQAKVAVSSGDALIDYAMQHNCSIAEAVEQLKKKVN